MEEKGRFPTWQSALTVRSQEIEGGNLTRQRAPKSFNQGMEEGGGPPTQQRALHERSQRREEDNPTRQRSPPACSQGTEEGGIPPEKQRTILEHGLQERAGGVPPEKEGEGWFTPRSATCAARARPDGGEGIGHPRSSDTPHRKTNQK